MDAVARQVCMAAEREVTMDGGCAGKILDVSRDYFAPEWADSVYHEVAHSR